MQTPISPTVTMTYQDAGQGRPLVLLHAFPLSGQMWHPQIATFSATHRVIAPDLRGFGGTSGFESVPSVEQMADDVAALLDALEIDEPVTLGGLSMGGYVALAFARRHPGRLRALILADTRAEADNDEAKAKRDERIAFAQSHSAGEFIEGMLPNLLGETTRRERPEVVQAVRTLAIAQSPQAIAAALQALRDRPDARPSLAAIAVPTLVLVGSEDTLTPPEAARTLAGGIIGAQLVEIEGAGHLSNLEQPEAFNAAAAQFLRV